MNILIQNTNLLTMEKEEIIISNIGIKDDKIIFVGDIPSDFVPDEIIEGEDFLTMPGLVNAHTHIAMSLMRNYADDLPFWPWLTEKIWPLEENLTAEDVYWGSLLSIIEMIRSGITCYNDMYFFMDEVAKATEIVGIRANLSRGLVGTKSEEANEKLKEAVEFYNRWNGKHNNLIKVELGPHAPYTCDDGYLREICEVNKEINAGIHIHLSESVKEVKDSYEQFGISPIEKMEKLDLFKYRTMAAHCVHVSDKDLEILKKYNVSVLNNPGSNMKLANGFANVKKMIDMGINVALGTDGSSSNNNLNMFEEINYAALINKAVSKNPTDIPAFTALKMATINGAKALGREDEIGSIKVGKKADIIMIDIRKPHFYPRYNLISSLVYSANASDVKNVIIDGKIVMKDYVLTTVNENEIMDKLEEMSKKLVEKVKI